MAMAAVAVAADSRSVTAIREWVTDLPRWAWRVLGARFDLRRDRYVPPGEATLRRALTYVDGDELDIAISAWITRQTGSDDAEAGGWAAQTTLTAPRGLSP